MSARPWHWIGLALLLTFGLGGCPPRPPSYVPDGQELGSDGIVYLYSRQKTSVFRYSPAEDRHLPSIGLARKPLFVRYSAALHALYVVYRDEVTRIDLDTGLYEVPFATLVDVPTGALEMDGHLLVMNRDFKTTFAPDGSETARMAFYTSPDSGADYVWSAGLGRVLYPRSDRIYSFAFDPATGTASDLQSSPEWPEFDFYGPVWPAADGSGILVANGDLLGPDFRVSGPLPVLPRAASWLADGGLITLADDGAGATLLEHWDPARSRFQFEPIAGTPLAVLERGGFIVVVTQGAVRPAFHVHTPSSDPDGDGVDTSFDAFPLDRAASLDTDHDGFPDAWNPGEGESTSTTGLALDAFPLDSACSLPEHGSGGVCDVAARIGPYDPAEIALGSDGVVYLLSPGEAWVHRWSAATQAPLNPIPTAPDPRAMAYFPERQKLYLGYASGQITEVDLQGDLGERPFAVTHGEVTDLVAAGDYLVATDWIGGWFHYTFDTGGAMTFRERNSEWGTDHEWSAGDGALYSLEGYGTLDLQRIPLDPNGAIGEPDDAWYGESTPPIRLSPDGSLAVVGTGFVYDTAALEPQGRLTVEPGDAVWLSDGLLTLREDAAGDTLLEQWDAAYRPVTAHRLSGSPLRMFAWGGSHLVVTSLAGVPTFHLYTIGPDPDGDGVDSPVDVFPLDPAASVDSDGDGFPDAWNPGFGPGDSTTGLELDAFPNFAACQRPEDGVGGVCDVAARVPLYAPAAIALDDRDWLYLFSPQTRRIYRYDLASAQHLDPIPIAAGATAMAWSAGADRLYVAYGDRRVARIDPLAPASQDLFAITWDVPVALLAGDSFLRVIDAYDGDTTTTLDWAGDVVEKRKHSKRSSAYEWDEASRRIYLYSSWFFDHIEWDEVDADGSVVDVDSNYGYAAGDTPVPLIRASLADGHILAGSGAVYRNPTLRLDTRVPGPVTDAHWMPDGRLLTLREDGAGGTRVDQHGRNGPDYDLWSTDVLPGDPLRLLAWTGGHVVVTEQAGRPAFHSYDPPDDSDGDGVENLADAFPLDPAASTDSDGDGHPDAWNPGMGPGDSTSGLALDLFPADVACHLAEHGVGGICDFERVVPSAPGEPVCSSDELGALPDSGFLDFTEDIRAFVPLCDGWVVTSTESKRVVVRHLPTGRTGLDVRLIEASRELVLDPAAKVVYGTLPAEDSLAVVDLVTGAVERIPIERPRSLSLGNDGDLYLITSRVFDPSVIRLDGQTRTFGVPTWSHGAILTYNAARDEVLTRTSAYNTSTLYRYAYDPVLGKTVLQSAPGGWIAANIAVSPDGEHVVSAGPPGTSRMLQDLWGSDLTVELGRVDLADNPPRSVSFDPSGTMLAASTAEDAAVFDVASHQPIVQWVPPGCGFGVKEVAFSRGSGLLLMKVYCSGSSYPPRLEWLRLD
ncbi:MAG: hypothetical protein ACQGVC_21610 [Myxococcota bacterium]